MARISLRTEHSFLGFSLLLDAVNVLYVFLVTLYSIVGDCWSGLQEIFFGSSVGMNKKLFDGMSKEDQEMIRIVCEAEAHTQGAEFQARNQGSLDILVAKHGVELKRYSDELLAEVRKVAGGVIDEVGNTDAITKKIYESYTAYQKTTMEWAKVAEQGYMNARSG